MIDRRSRLRRIVETEIPVLLIVIFAIGPYVWMILTSLKTEGDIAAFPVRYLPTAVTLEHYRSLLARTSFSGNLLNSLVVALAVDNLLNADYEDAIGFQAPGILPRLSVRYRFE